MPSFGIKCSCYDLVVVCHLPPYHNTSRSNMATASISLPSSITFTKMHGCGNDYIYIDCTLTNKQHTGLLELASASITDCDPTNHTTWLLLVRWLCNRNYGIGADGVVLVCDPYRSQAAQCRMVMFNSDGSRARMCGNGIRCVALFHYNNSKQRQAQQHIDAATPIDGGSTTHDGSAVISYQQPNTTFAVESDSGDCNASIVTALDDASQTTTQTTITTTLPWTLVSIDMDQPSIVLQVESTINEQLFRCTCVNVGNPHCVILVDSSLVFDSITPINEKQQQAWRILRDFNVPLFGPLLEHASFIPEQSNVEVVPCRSMSVFNAHATR
jgi:diaminopimelate epimerase